MGSKGKKQANINRAATERARVTTVRRELIMQDKFNL